ncbi:MAG: 4'-phosphopantetheinyl transferase [Chloroflexi bacterium]|nr:MAG: 4'-phosphopantetheinyl transferase [Chloroflexota bacterium]
MFEDPFRFSQMINWIFLKNSDVRFQECIENPEGYFDSTELDEYRKFIVPKRKMEWLISRMLVKQLVASSFDPPLTLSPRLITIRKMSSGVPYVEIDKSGRVGWLSLSHSNGGVFAAFSRKESQHFGVDLEFIEERSPQLIADYFTDSESRQVNSSQGEDINFHANLIWSAKEAFLKAIEKGLQLDTRCIEIIGIKPKCGDSEWGNLEFKAEVNGSQAWRILFRREAGFVLTLCIPADQQIGLARIIMEP